MNKHSTNILKVAKQFSIILNQWIPEKLFEVNLRNKEQSYIDHGCCATHDFCDPNQAIIDAFKFVFGKDPSVKNQKDNMIINNAWTIAKTANFKIDYPLYNNL
jgi:hypothetical protein